MNRTRSYGAARALATCALAVAIALACAPLGRAAPKAEPRLTHEQWAKIEKRLEQNGQTRILPFKVADHLKLTRGTQVLTVYELAFEREGYQHGIYRSVDRKDDRIVLAFRTPEKKWTAFLTDTKFKLISAIVWNAGEDVSQWPNTEALAAFNNELVYWSVIADLL